MSTSKTIATWNIQRGGQYPDVIRLLKRHSVDIALLQECDIGMARSGNVHVPRVIAQGLGPGHAFVIGIEFEEEGLGNQEEVETLPPGAANKNGLHCNAIVSADIPFIAHTIELSAGREWKLDGDQPRYGGRVAVVVRIDGIFYVSVHLEARTSAEKRIGQFQRLLHALDKLGADRVVIGGDLNTKYVEDYIMFTGAEERGYKWRDANLDVGRFAGRRLDWFVYRGVTVARAATIDTLGTSDHDLMLLQVSA